VSPGHAAPDDPRHLFVYGTLQPGESRWVHLERFVTGDGVPATVAGSLYDTGLGYPAARFGTDDTIVGRVYELVDHAAALAHLDDVEGAVRGLYHRVVVLTHTGTPAWAYECGDEALLARHLAGGDWRQRSSTGSWG
jgi:gamma-glutamylcyclotransferase (GGCT)/AIG2-like uncharacterized protein YtfP